MVHVKMGSEKGLVRNNADIYSGLGLDVSPSSSLEDITDGSLYSSPKSQDAPIDSPMMIFQAILIISSILYLLEFLINEFYLYLCCLNIRFSYV